MQHWLELSNERVLPLASSATIADAPTIGVFITLVQSEAGPQGVEPAELVLCGRSVRFPAVVTGILERTKLAYSIAPFLCSPRWTVVSAKRAFLFCKRNDLYLKVRPWKSTSKTAEPNQLCLSTQGGNADGSAGEIGGLVEMVSSTGVATPASRCGLMSSERMQLRRDRCAALRRSFGPRPASGGVR